MKITKRIISFFLVLILCFTSFNMPVMASEKNSEQINPLQAISFEKTGKVITIINNLNKKFYIKTENFDTNKDYLSPAVLQEITKDDFEKYYKSKSFDKVEIKNIIQDGDKRTYLVVDLDKDGNMIDTSWAGTISAGTFDDLSVNTTDKTYSWILNDHGKYFLVTKSKNDKKSVYKQITNLDYEKFIFDKNYTYSRVIKDIKTSDGIVYSDVSYDKNNKQLGIETLVTKDSSINIAEIFYLINALNSAKKNNKDIVYSVGSIQQYINQYKDNNEKNEKKETTLDDIKSSFDIPENLKEKYKGKYEFWSDDYNSGYIGNWSDPYFNGKSTVLEWEDPFWKNSDIHHGNSQSSLTHGYYDDYGNYIKLDINGNPIPKENGVFDSAGNFKPNGIDGYYDSNGIYHPTFNQINGIKYDNNSNIYIGNNGYIDSKGTWHSNKKTNESILYDGRIIYNSGVLYNPKTDESINIKADIFGKFFIENDEIVYPDYSVYNKSNNTLTLADGTSYKGITSKNYILFSNNTAIMNDTYEKGIKEDSDILLTNGTKIMDNGIIKYPNNIVYNNGTITYDEDKTVKNMFVQDYIDLANYGRIYKNGHIATYNDYNQLVTDNDCIINKNNIIILFNGNLFMNNTIYPVYRDSVGNWIATNGIVYNRELKFGTYNSAGTFIEDSFPNEDYYYDHNGNMIYFNGKVIKNNITGFYNEHGIFDSNFTRHKDGYYTSDKVFIKDNRTIILPDNSYGFYDKSNNFVTNNNSGYFNTKGIFINNDNTNIDIGSISKDGLFSPNNTDPFVFTMDGQIKLLGEDGIYDENGLVKIKNQKGYYDSKGIFVVLNQNPYVIYNYFYDSKGIKHNLNLIYKDSQNAIKLLKNPNIGLSIVNNKIKLSHNDTLYETNGLTTIKNKKGYYNQNGKFIVSDISPYFGGFYDDTGLWIDHSYYEDTFGNLCINNGGYDYMGNYITPSGDIGSFDSAGKFNLNKVNSNKGFFYTDNGTKKVLTNIYIDDMGLYKDLSSSIVYDKIGNQVNSSKSNEFKLSNYTYLKYGTFVDDKGNIGYFTKDKKFVLGHCNYKNGFFDPNGAFIQYNNKNKKNTNYTFLNNKYFVLSIDSNNYILYSSDGYSFPVQKIDNYYILSDGMALSEDGNIGYISKSNTFNKGIPTNFTDINDNINSITSTSSIADNNTLSNNPTNDSSTNSIVISTPTQNYIDVSDNTGYFLKNGTYIKYSGEYGYFTKDKKFNKSEINPYLNGFYMKNGKWVSTSTESNPNIGYFNKYGSPRNGTNQYKNGYYDYEGSYHPFNKKYYINSNGNVTSYGDKYIGYKDKTNKYYPNNDKGYFDSDGTYYIGNKLIGYYDKNGELNKGKNINFDGFYDKQGFWHLFNDPGYYDKKGNYISSVSDETNGYFNEAGELEKGYNPYINGYFDSNGSWSNNDNSPLTVYFDVNGEMKIGLNKYKNGFYDMYKNWYPTGNDGYFDKYGTYYSISSNISGYYDNRGNYYEGTNPYQHGYYNALGELKIFNHPGKFDKNGTYIDDNNQPWHFAKDGAKNKGKNTDTAGFYDGNENYYLLNENSYITKNNLKYPTILQVSKYKVGSPDYILFEGKFKNSSDVPYKTQNTLQFTINNNHDAPIYVDTGIKVSVNAMVSYENAKDLIHNISIYSKSQYVEDNNSCMTNIDGNIISLKNNGKISVKSLSDKFVNSDISIVVAKSRLGETYILAESIENNKKVNIYINNKKQIINSQMIVHNSIPYLSLNDFADIIQYNARTSNENGNKVITFLLKDNGNTKLPSKIVTSLNSKNCVSTDKNRDNQYSTLKAPIIEYSKDNSKSKELYIPVYMLSLLSGKNVEYNTKQYSLILNDKKEDLPITDN